MNLKVGDIVNHRVFGIGTVLELFEDYADIDFQKVGKKSIVYSALEEIKTGGVAKPCVDNNHFVVTCKDILDELFILTSNENGCEKVESIISNLRYKKDWDINEKTLASCVKISNGVITNKNVKSAKFLLKIGFKNDFEFTINKYVDSLDESSSSKELNVRLSDNIVRDSQNAFNKFRSLCCSDSFYNTSKLYIAKCIIDHLSKQDSNEEYSLDYLINDFINCYLYQNGFGTFKNSQFGSDLNFLDAIRQSAEDNVLTAEEKENLQDLIYYFLLNNGLKPFCEQSNIAKIENENLVFDSSTVKGIKTYGKQLNTSIVNRLSYFLCARNNQSQVKAYISGLRKEQYKNSFELTFKYQNELDELSKELIEDFYLKNDFKLLMKKHGIPTTEAYLTMCLARIDFSLRGKRIILRSKYTSLKAYYKEQILKQEVYRYSNPFNLKEYDDAIRFLISDLVLIDIGGGDYLTSVNMEKCGVTEEVKENFKKSLYSFAKNNMFFSIKQIEEQFTNNPVIEYCNGDINQLIQFIKSVPEINTLTQNKKAIIFTLLSRDNRINYFFESFLENDKALDIYDLKDIINEAYDVEYEIDDLIKDVMKSSLYYSEDMEKVYLAKKYYIREVFGNGN